MYKHKNIARFIDKVNKEAAEAANKVYEKYQPALIEMIQAQLHEEDILTIAMGSACVERKGREENYLDSSRDGFTIPIAQTQYQQEDYPAGFNLPSVITKRSVKI